MDHVYIRSGPSLCEPASPISQAVVAGDQCYVSGQLATDLTGCFQPGSVLEEAELAFSNFFAALETAGFHRDDVVFIDLAFIDLNDLPQINDLWGSLFPADRRPARTIYQAAALPNGGKIKVQGIAVRRR